MNLQERASQTLKTREEWLQQAIQAENYISQLPEEIIALDGESDTNSNGTLTIQIYFDHTQSLIAFSNHGIKEWQKTFNEYSGSYNYTGKGIINGINVNVTIYKVAGG